MRHFNKLLFAFFLLPFFSAAQSNFKPGYVVTLKGDTLKGFIDYKEWDKNPSSLSFKSRQNISNAEGFTTKNALAFAITGMEYYERYVLPISQDPVDVNKLSPKPDTSYLTDTVFLRISTKGKYLTLYSYTDDIKPRFYLLEAGETQPQELIYHAFYNPDVSASIQYITRYRNQLENVAQKFNVNTNTVNEWLLKSNYTESELIKAVQAINGSSSVQFTPPNLSEIRWFAGIGISYSNLNFEGNGIGITGNSGGFSPKITGGFDFIGNKNTQSILLRAEFSFTYNPYKFSSINNLSTPQSTSNLNFTQYNSSITPQIIFNFYNKQAVKLFIDAGISLNISTYNKYQYTTTFNDSFAPSVQNNYPEFHQFWASFPIKAGVAINGKIEISVCYIPSSSITNYSTFSGAVTSYQAGVNYLFGK